MIRDTLPPELITFSPSLPACSSAPSAVTIVLAVIGSVVLIGIILLGLWKLLVTIHDRREFDRFQSERSRARYEMVSPGWRCCWGTGGGHQDAPAANSSAAMEKGGRHKGCRCPCPAVPCSRASGTSTLHCPSPWQVTNILQNYAQPLVSSCIFDQCWRAEGGGGVGAKL